MEPLSRRDFLYLGVAGSAAGLLAAGTAEPPSVHEQLLDLAACQERERRARFAAVASRADLAALQKSLREKFLALLDGLPTAQGAPPTRSVGQIEADDYRVEKLVWQSFPGYFVPALLYRPRAIATRLPAVLSPCGHSTTGKADDTYQQLHVNLVKRGFIVLTYDPVGQGERSQFWDAERQKSRFNMSCGEHAVLGNPLYLLGTSLARYRIWDGMRGIDYLASLPEVDSTRIGCVGNSGGGTLTAYISALDPRVAAAAICCYITTLPRRMANRIQADPAADPEQDIFGFVSAGIDHAGLLALLAPRPVLIGAARLDFFPIEGTRESFAEAKRLYEIADAGERIGRFEAAAKHGLTLPLREAVYGWFERWLAGRQDAGRAEEVPVTPRPAEELRVCGNGQVNVTFRSLPLLPLALGQFAGKRARVPLRQLLRLDPEAAAPRIRELAAGGATTQTLIACVNGNESPGWHEEREFLQALTQQGYAVVVIDPRGVGELRAPLTVRGNDYADPLSGVEENIAYNAFLVGKSLLGMRVTDVLAALERIAAQGLPRRVVLCGRRDAALVACLAAAVEPTITRLAVEEMLYSFRPLFDARGYPINASHMLPGMLRDFGDVADVLADIAPRRVLGSAGIGASDRLPESFEIVAGRFTRDPKLLIDWLRD